MAASRSTPHASIFCIVKFETASQEMPICPLHPPHSFLATQDFRALRPWKCTRPSRCRIFFDDVLNLLLVCLTIPLEEIVSVSLCWRVRIGVVEQILDAKKDLFDSNSRLPTFLFIQYRETDCTRWIDIGVEKRGYEFACRLVSECSFTSSNTIAYTSVAL